jgi:hypothetical protein
VPNSCLFEAIRRAGEQDLSRPASARCWSRVAAGFAIGMSLLAKGFLASILPHADWATGIANLGYTVGLLTVIRGRMQSFTENTITPILPVFLAPTRSNFAQSSRLGGSSSRARATSPRTHHMPTSRPSPLSTLIAAGAKGNYRRKPQVTSCVIFGLRAKVLGFHASDKIGQGGIDGCRN